MSVLKLKQNGAWVPISVGAQGTKGDPGDAGPANTLTIGTVTSGIEASATITGESPNQVLNLVLQQGEKGDSGVYVGAGDMPEGYNVQIDPSGSGDEIVTAENIESALGYIPADSEDVSAKLDKPSTPPEVGKILKVTAVNEDGSFVCEWADAPSGGGAVDDVHINGTSIVGENGIAEIPIIKRGKFGLPLIDPDNSARENNGIDVDDRFGNIKVIISPTWRIDSRATNTVISPPNLDYAVKTAMCDGKGAAWNDAERLAALLRMGCTVDDNGFVKWTAQGVAE